MEPGYIEPAQRSCFTRIAGRAEQAAPKPVKHLYNRFVTAIGKKINELSASYILPVISNAAKAKVLPLSSPAGWENESRLKERDIKQLEAKIHSTEVQIASLSSNPANPAKEHLPKMRKIRARPHKVKLPKEKRIQLANEKRKQLDATKQKLKNKLETAKIEKYHLNIRKNSQIASRLAGYVGWGTSGLIGLAPQITSGLIGTVDLLPVLTMAEAGVIVIPNPAAFAVANCIQALAIHSQFKSAHKLPNSREMAKEMRNVRISTLCWIASMVYTIAVHSTYQNVCADSSASWICTVKSPAAMVLENFSDSHP